MKKLLKCFVALLMIVSVTLSLVPSASASYVAPNNTIKVGLYYTPDGSSTQKAFTSANLQNQTGYGYGYELGFFDSNRVFNSIGAYILDTNAITAVMDKNIYYDYSSRSYKQGTEGSIVVGCYHIQLDTAYYDFATAQAAASTFTSVNAFVKYANGVFYVCAGHFLNAEDATAVAADLGIQQTYTITSGTAYTVALVQTGTDRILFEFDYGTAYDLAVRPLCDSGVKARTYHRGYIYYGDFSFRRNNGGSITVINYVNIEDYVKGLLPYEMSSSWPIEALKAQAVCARTYATAKLNNHGSSGFDICNTTCCQVYRGVSSATANTDAAVDATAGVYLTYNGELCETYFMSSDGGATENSENVWTKARPYLRGVVDPYEAAVAQQISNYNWTYTYTGDQLAEKLRNKGYSCSTIHKFEVLQFSDTGNVVKVRLTDVNGKEFTFSKDNCRIVLGLRSLRFTVNGIKPEGNSIYINSPFSFVTELIHNLFAVGGGGVGSLTSGEVYAITGTGEIEKIGGAEIMHNTFVISGSGYGHNVGMSQWGAYSMAKHYMLTYTDILTFYYTGAQLTYLGA